MIVLQIVFSVLCIGIQGLALLEQTVFSVLCIGMQGLALLEVALQTVFSVLCIGIQGSRGYVICLHDCTRCYDVLLQRAVPSNFKTLSTQNTKPFGTLSTQTSLVFTFNYNMKFFKENTHVMLALLDTLLLCMFN